MGDSFRMRHHLSQAASVEILHSKAPITHPFSDLYFSSHTPVEQQKKINYPTAQKKTKQQLRKAAFLALCFVKLLARQSIKRLNSIPLISTKSTFTLSDLYFKQILHKSLLKSCSTFSGSLTAQRRHNLQLRRCNLTNDAATRRLHQAAALLGAPRVYSMCLKDGGCRAFRDAALQTDFLLLPRGLQPVWPPWPPTSTKQFPSPLAHWIFFTYREPFCVNPYDQPPSPPLRVTSRRPHKLLLLIGWSAYLRKHVILSFWAHKVSDWRLSTETGGVGESSVSSSKFRSQNLKWSGSVHSL